MPACNKHINPERLRKYETAALAKASGISIRGINAAKHTGSVRRRTWHALLAAMRVCKRLPKHGPPRQMRDAKGRFLSKL